MGDLFDKITDIENLSRAYVNARRGKSLSVSALDFRTRKEAELQAIRHELEDGTFSFGSYRRFTILDPKKRIICAAPFRERVVHHAIIRVIGPELEKYQIHRSYACRAGKGTERAVLQAYSWARSSPWFVKLDVRKGIATFGIWTICFFSFSTRVLPPFFSEARGNTYLKIYRSH